MSVQQVSLGRVFGEVTASAAAGGVSIWEFAYAPRQMIPAHQHSSAYICFLIAGDILETSQAETITYSRSRLVYLPKGVKHAAIVGPDGARAIGFEISCFGAGLPDRPVRLADARLRLMIHRAALSARLGEGLEMAALPDTIVGELMAAPKTESQRWISRLMEFIDAHCTEALAIGDLARLAGRHPSHLMRTFREMTGHTIGAYCRKARVERAARLLRGEDSLTAIAAECGFSDLSHLGRLFRCEYGMSPGEFRRALQ